MGEAGAATSTATGIVSVCDDVSRAVAMEATVRACVSEVADADWSVRPWSVRHQEHRRSPESGATTAAPLVTVEPSQPI